MKKAITAIAGSFLIATVAAAQPAPPPPLPGGWNPHEFWRGAPENVHERIDFLQQRIDRGRADGTLDPHEYERVSMSLNEIRSWAREVRAHDGGHLQPLHEQEVQGRLDRLSQQIHWMRTNGR